MRHFFSFQKKKALYLVPGGAQSEALAHQLNHELMAVGHVLSQEAFALVASQDTATLAALHADLVGGIHAVTGGDGHEPIYRNFPQSVLALSYGEFVINALLHYWSEGTWRPADVGHLTREICAEPQDGYRVVGVLTADAFWGLFTDLLYGQVSLSAFDKAGVDWYLDQGGALDFGRISFQETASYVGKRLLESPDLERLPVQRATLVLRLWSAYSGGDEGLKTNTRYRLPRTGQRRLLLETLERCTDLEDSFKTHRERWLRLLYYLHPMTPDHRARYPQVAHHADLLRNRPSSLQTFQARVEAALAARDPLIFALLARRPGVFLRRLDHLVRLFGIEAIRVWLETLPSFSHLITAYNHFSGRDVAQSGRGAVLASQDKSELVTYKSLEPLDSALVAEITESLLTELRRFQVAGLSGRVHIDLGLYHTPLSTNNRASSLSLDSKAIGTTELCPARKTLRLYVHWEGKSDIDLSAFAIAQDGTVIKVGWNATHHAGEYLVYSGDNTGISDKNAEYIDINLPQVPPEITWIIVEARIFRGPDSFAGYEGTVHMGWMAREAPEANRLWLPETLQHAMVLQNQARVAYLLAYHPASQNIVYLDMSMGSSIVSTHQDALRFRIFLDKFAHVTSPDQAPSWASLKQGHILELLSPALAASPQEADVCFGEDTTAEQVSRLMTQATRLSSPSLSPSSSFPSPSLAETMETPN